MKLNKSTFHLVFLISLFPVQSFSSHSLIMEFLSMKHLHGAIILSCDDSIDDIKLLHALMSFGIRSAVIYINGDNDLLEMDQSLLMMEAMEVDDGTAWILSSACFTNSSTMKKMFHDAMFHDAMFHFSHQWMIIQDQNDTSTDYLTNLPLNFDSEVTVARFVAEKNSWRMEQVYKIRQKLYTETRGGTAKYDSRNQLKGVTLKSSVVISGKIPQGQNLIQFLRDDQALNENSFGKNVFALIEMMAATFQFSIEVERTHTWGYLMNGSFEGMLGALQRGEADLAMSPLYLKEERLQVCEVIAETTYQKVVIMFLDEGRSSDSWRAFLSPIEQSAWRAASLCVLLGTLALWICKRLQSVTHDARSSSEDVCFISIRTICQQGASESCHLPSFRLSLLSLLVFSFLFFQFYSASIVSSLLRQPPRTIRTPEDFLASNMQLVAEDVIYNRVLLKKSTVGVIQQLYQKKLLKGPKGGFVSVREGILLIQGGGCGFLVDITDIYDGLRQNFSMRQLCQLAELQLGPTYKLISAVKKKSHFKELLTFGYRKLSERGVVAKESSRWHTQKPQCVAGLAGKHMEGLGPERLTSAFILLGIAAIIAVLLLVIEIMYQHRQTSIR